MNFTNNIYCVLSDCNKATCHHCFPVRNCSYNHDFCKENVRLDSNQYPNRDLFYDYQDN